MPMTLIRDGSMRWTAQSAQPTAARLFHAAGTVRVVAARQLANRPGWTILRRTNMSFLIYIIGVVIFIGGLIYGAVLMNVPTQWIVVGTLVLLGLSVLMGVNSTRQKDPSS